MARTARKIILKKVKNSKTRKLKKGGVRTSTPEFNLNLKNDFDSFYKEYGNLPDRNFFRLLRDISITNEDFKKYSIMITGKTDFDKDSLKKTYYFLRTLLYLSSQEVFNKFEGYKHVPTGKYFWKRLYEILNLENNKPMFQY